jgi:hypothetical protein
MLDFDCSGPGCDNVIFMQAEIKGGEVLITGLTFCCQDCFDDHTFEVKN